MALPGYADDCELVNEDGGGDDNGIADMDGGVEQGFMAVVAGVAVEEYPAPCGKTRQPARPVCN